MSMSKIRANRGRLGARTPPARLGARKINTKTRIRKHNQVRATHNVPKCRTSQASNNKCRNSQTLEA